MSEQTNADLVLSASYWNTNRAVANPRGAYGMIFSLAARLEAAERRAEQAEAELRDVWRTDIPSLKDQRDALAAVVEKVRDLRDVASTYGPDEFGVFKRILREALVTDREHTLTGVKAAAWDEGWSAAGAWQIAEPGTPYPWNPYRREEELMSDFTPTTSSVRDRYAACRIPKGVRATVAKEEFDRWLAEHDEKVRAETLREFAGDLNDAMRRGVVDPAKFAELSADRAEERKTND